MIVGAGARLVGTFLLCGVSPSFLSPEGEFFRLRKVQIGLILHFIVAWSWHKISLLKVVVIEFSGNRVTQIPLLLLR